jgi:hypothetical protein
MGVLGICGQQWVCQFTWEDLLLVLPGTLPLWACQSCPSRVCGCFLDAARWARGFSSWGLHFQDTLLLSCAWKFCGSELHQF